MISKDVLVVLDALSIVREKELSCYALAELVALPLQYLGLDVAIVEGVGQTPEGELNPHFWLLVDGEHIDPMAYLHEFAVEHDDDWHEETFSYLTPRRVAAHLSEYEAEYWLTYLLELCSRFSRA